MGDLIISRKAVLDRFKGICDVCGENKKYNGVMCGTCYLDDAIDFVEDMPTVTNDTRHKKGKWLIDEERGADGIYMVCSNCDEVIYITGDFKFCPNCGADMRESHD